MVGLGIRSGLGLGFDSTVSGFAIAVGVRFKVKVKVTMLPDSAPAHQALLRQVELSVGRLPDPFMETSARSSTLSSEPTDG